MLNVLVLVVVAMVLAVGLDPAVERLVERGLARGWAVTALMLALALLTVLFGILVLPSLIHQVSGLGDDIPRYLSRLQTRDDRLGRAMQSNDVTARVQMFLHQLPRAVGDSFGTVLGVAGKLGAAIFAAITVLILTIYFMLSLPSMRRTATILVLPHQRWQADRVIDSSISRIGGYVTGNLITSVVCGAVSLVTLLALGVPFAVPLAVWAGLADLIPAVGSYLGAAPAIIVAFFTSPLLGVLVAVYFVVYQQIENYVIVPRVMKDAVNLSPAAVIIATLVGGSLAGFAGALLALPVAATIKVVIVEVWLRDRVRQGDPLAQEQIEEADA